MHSKGSEVKKLLFALFLSQLIFSASASMLVPAVTTDSNGLLSELRAEVLPGTGNVWVNIQPFIGTATQQSARMAASLASNLAGVDVKKYDFYFEIKSTAESVDGPSAGAAFTLLAYSALKNKQIRGDFTLTGTIGDSGYIGQIGGVKEKIIASGEYGMKIVAVPMGQSVAGGEGLKTMAWEEWEMQIVEVSRIQEIINIAFTPAGSYVEVNETITPPLVLPYIEIGESVSPFKYLAEREVNTTKKLYEEMMEKYKNDSDIMEVLYQWKKDINESEYLLNNNYLYSAANNAFIVMVGLKTVLNSEKTPLEIEKYVENLSDYIEANFTYPQMNSNNYEWIGGGQQRRIWAMKKIAEVRGLLKTDFDTITVLREAMYAETWYEASNDLFKIAKEINGTPVSDEELKLTAELIINESGELLNVSNDVDGIWKLEAAIDAFNKSMYIAAIYDARYSKAVFTTESIVSGKEMSEIEEMIKSSYVGGGIWAQLYADHALYLAETAKRYEDRNYIVSAYRIHYFATFLEIAKNDIKKSLVEVDVPAENGEPKIEVSYQLEDANQTIRTILIISITAVIVLTIVIIILLSKRKKHYYYIKGETKVKETVKKTVVKKKLVKKVETKKVKRKNSK